MSVVAIIPARGNSKRLPGKNIRELDGRPLIAYSCLVARACHTIDDVIVASDDSKILDAYPYNNLPIELPDGLTTDDATLVGTLQYTLQCLEADGNKYDWVALMQPTCPLRQPSLVDRWIWEVRDKEIDGVLTVDIDRFKLGRQMGNLFTPDYIPMTPKALVEERMRENGVFYLFKTENVLQGNPFTHRMLPVVCPREQSLCNIDTQADWDMMKYYYFEQGYREMFEELDRG